MSRGTLAAVLRPLLDCLRRLELSVGLTLALWLGATRAYACACPPSLKVGSELARSDAVVVARVIAVEPAPLTASKVARKLFHLHVERAFKEHPNLAETIVLRTSSKPEQCGRVLQVGETYLLYTQWRDGVWIDTVCSRTALLNAATADYEALVAAEAGQALPLGFVSDPHGSHGSHEPHEPHGSHDPHGSQGPHESQGAHDQGIATPTKAPILEPAGDRGWLLGCGALALAAMAWGIYRWRARPRAKD